MSENEIKRKGEESFEKIKIKFLRSFNNFKAGDVVDIEFKKGIYLIAQSVAVMDENWILEKLRELGIGKFKEKFTKKLNEMREEGYEVPTLENIISSAFNDNSKILETKREKERINKNIELEIRNVTSLDELVKLVPRPSYFYKLVHIYDDIEESHDLIVSANINFRLFLCYFGKNSKPFLLFSLPHEDFPKTNKGTFLVPVSMDEIEKYFYLRRDNAIELKPQLVRALLKSLRLRGNAFNIVIGGKIPILTIFKVSEDGEEIIYELPIYKRLYNLPSIFFEEIVKNNWVRELRLKAFPQNDLDERIYWIAISAKINFSTKPKSEYMKYQPHIIIISPTKTGKTTTMQKVHGEENVYSRATYARLLGYSTADDIYPGDLQNRTETLILDEINKQGYQPYFFDMMLNFWEQGTCTIATGAQTLPVKGLCQTILLANTEKMDATPQELLLGLQNFLDYFTATGQRIGSRVLLIIGTDFKQNPTIEVNEDYLILYNFLCKKVSEFIDEYLMKNKKILDLLNQPFREEEKNLINYYLSHISNSIAGKVVDFWKGFLEAYKHFNGLVFKISIIKYLEEYPDFLLDPHLFDFDEFKKIFEEVRETVFSWFERSLKATLESIPNYLEYLKIKLKALPTYLQVFIKLVSLYCYDLKKEDLDKLHPIEVLIPYFEKLEEEAKYLQGRFSLLKEKIKKGVSIVNTYLNPFGLQLYFLPNDEIFFKVNAQYFELLKHLVDKK